MPVFFRPSLLATNDARYGWKDNLNQALFPKISWMLPQSVREIKVEDLAKAMCINAQSKWKKYSNFKEEETKEEEEKEEKDVKENKEEKEEKESDDEVAESKKESKKNEQKEEKKKSKSAKSVAEVFTFPDFVKLLNSKEPGYTENK